MPFFIREISGLADVRELIKIHNITWDNSPGIIDLLANASACYLATDPDSGAVVGYAFIQHDSTRGHVELNDIAIHPDRRRTGCGEQLVRHIMDHHPCVKLCARETNSRLVSFYERLGFERVGTFENYYDVSEDAVRMRWPASA